MSFLPIRDPRLRDILMVPGAVIPGDSTDEEKEAPSNDTPPLPVKQPPQPSIIKKHALYTEQADPATGAPTTLPDGSQGVIGQKTTRTPTKLGKALGFLGQLAEGGITAAATPNQVGGGPVDFFRAASATNKHFADKREAQRKQGEQGRQDAIQDFEMRRQIGMDKRAQELRDETSRANQAREAQNARNDQTREQNNADQNFINATKDGRYSTIAPDLSVFLEGKAAPEFKTPDGFDRAQYEKIGGRWLKWNDKTPSDVARDEYNILKAAAAGMKYVDEAGNVTKDINNARLMPMTEAERSAVQNSTINRNSANADLANRRSAYLDRSLDIRNKMAGIALMNARTNAERLKLAKDRFGLDYTGETEDGRVILTDPSTGQIVIPRIASFQKVPAAQARKVADAEVMDTAGDDLVGMINDIAKQGKIGPIAGRIEMGKERLGYADPDVKALVVGLKHYADQLPDTYGARGAAMAARFEDSIKNIDQDPESVVAAIQEIQKYGGYIKGANQQVIRPGGGVPASRPLVQTKPTASTPKLSDKPPSQPVVFGPAKEGYRMVDPTTGKTMKVGKGIAAQKASQGWKYVVD